MRSLLKIFFTGMLISFLGSLPLATMNVAAMQISISESVGAAVLFSLGSLLVEVIYVRISVVAIGWISKQKKLFRILEYVTLLIVLALAASSFYAAMHPGVQKNVVLSSTLPKFLLGASMCAVSPGQIPFWIGWSTVLLEKKYYCPKTISTTLILPVLALAHLQAIAFLFLADCLSQTVSAKIRISSIGS